MKDLEEEEKHEFAERKKEKALSSFWQGGGDFRLVCLGKKKKRWRLRFAVGGNS